MTHTPCNKAPVSNDLCNYLNCLIWRLCVACCVRTNNCHPAAENFPPSCLVNVEKNSIPHLQLLCILGMNTDKLIFQNKRGPCCVFCAGSGVLYASPFVTWMTKHSISIKVSLLYEFTQCLWHFRSCINSDVGWLQLCLSQTSWETSQWSRQNVYVHMALRVVRPVQRCQEEVAKLNLHIDIYVLLPLQFPTGHEARGGVCNSNPFWSCLFWWLSNFLTTA